MKVKNIISTSVFQFEQELKELLANGFKPNLAIVFSSSELDNLSIGSVLKDESIEFVACGSAGEIVQGVAYSNSISASLFEIDKSSFHIVKQSVDIDQSYPAGIKLAKVALDKFDNPSFISLFSMGVHGEKFIAGVRDVLGKDPNMYGGMAADELEYKAYVFTHDNKDLNGIHTLIIDSDKIDVSGFAIAGWESIGTEHTITKSKDNVIYEINDEPALDFFKKFFGFFTDPLSQHSGKVTTVNAQYPLQLMRNDSPILRAPLGSDEDERTLTLAGPVNQGEKFKFSIAPGFGVIDQTIKEFKKFKEEIEKPDAIILFSCKARHWAFGPMIEDELEALDKLWDIPYQGFFTFGEIGKNKDQQTSFFNETCCLVSLKEK